MSRIDEIKEALNLADRHLWDLIDEGELIEHIRNILEENNRLREERDSFQRVGIQTLEKLNAAIKILESMKK